MTSLVLTRTPERCALADAEHTLSDGRQHQRVVGMRVHQRRVCGHLGTHTHRREVEGDLGLERHQVPNDAHESEAQFAYSGANGQCLLAVAIGKGPIMASYGICRTLILPFLYGSTECVANNSKFCTFLVHGA
jgi:hypothetical protein